MAVSIWAILGIILVLLWWPVSYVTPAAGGFTLGSGVAFLIVAASNWAWERVGRNPEMPDLESQ
jgi:hypothetical protein